MKICSRKEQKGLLDVQKLALHLDKIASLNKDKMMHSASSAKVRRKTQLIPTHPSGDTRFKVLDVTIKRYQYQQDALIEILHKAQELFGYLENDLFGQRLSKQKENASMLSVMQTKAILVHLWIAAF